MHGRDVSHLIAGEAEEDAAREEAACDFVGKLLSDKAMLNDFCEAIKNQEVSKEAAKGAINAIKSIIGRFSNKLKKGDTATAELVVKVKESFNTDIETATEAIKALQTAYNEVTKSDALLKNKNTTNEGGVKRSTKEKNNTKTSAASPLSRGPATHRSFSVTDDAITAAANNLDINTSLSQIPENVKGMIVFFCEVERSSNFQQSYCGFNASEL